MPLIDYTNFIGKLNLPQTGNIEGRTLIDQFIGIYETEYLKKALGYDLWKAFVAGMFGTVLGAELVTNGGFVGSAAGWSLGADWFYNTNKVTHNPVNTLVLFQPGTLDDTKTYRVSFNISGTNGFVGVYLGHNLVTSAVFKAGQGDVSFDSTWYNDVTLIEFHPDITFNGSITNVSVKEVTLEQRWIDLLEGKEFQYAGKNYSWNGFDPDSKLTPIANYVYYKYMEEKASDNTLIGTAAGVVDNNTRVNPMIKMVDAWNSMVEMNKSLWYFLKANKDVYPEWTGWQGTWEFWSSQTKNEVFHFKNTLDI